MQIRQLLLVLFLPSLSAQTPAMEVGSDLAKEHLASRVEPTFPAIAKAAHVAGDVTLMVTIGETGKVVGVKALSGPDMLKGAAIDAVRKWRYRSPRMARR